jgi:TusA-related sulfurtransferase
MSEQLDAIVLDMRGEVCPGPLVKAVEAMRTADENQQIEIVTDFIPAVLNVTNASLKQGWNISVQRLDPGEWKMILTRDDAAGTQV